MTTLNELCAYLLPSDEHLTFRSLILEEQRIILVAATSAPKAACPDCHRLTDHIHSRYQRTLADLPWATAPIELRLTVRRFACTTCTCSRQTFTERLPTVAPLYARTTTRLTETQTYSGLALGGAAGARHLSRQGLPVSRYTVLRRVRRASLPQGPPPQVIGIDDWAWRKGHRYGTIIVDLERGCPIDVLEDRLAQTVADWLQAHPTVEIVARDRAESYASGIQQGAPDAIQVADRFHLLKNLAEALQEVFTAHSQELTALNDTENAKSVTLEDGTIAVPIAPPEKAPTAQALAQQRREQRLANYNEVWSLHEKGLTAQAVAERVGISSRTVCRFLQTKTFPERQPRLQLSPTSLDPFKAHVLERWNEGCRNASQIFRELQAKGFQGPYGTVARYARRLRVAQGGGVKADQPDHPLPVVETAKSLTPRGAVWLIMRRQEGLDDEERRQLAQLNDQEGEIGKAISLTEDFIDLVRQKQPEGLETWLEKAAASCLSAFERFARGIREDSEAVKAGLTLPWSTGPVEGQINRLKMLKRQMYGRANIDLLKQRVVLRT
ncbi:ISL3 family transposase [Candidatus Entotheonella palauensis]|uniref:ISL3 family transposase n=1 Tax=Candidatus Entotheonella palauensis TaxID=93172 RepID=UPI000B7D44F4|nr:ISL3 family transposase [Candidatus Entotheonella palauensis]